MCMPIWTLVHTHTHMLTHSLLAWCWWDQTIWPFTLCLVKQLEHSIERDSHAWTCVLVCLNMQLWVWYVHVYISCIYVCMHVCMHFFMCVCSSACMLSIMYVCMHASMHVCMYDLRLEDQCSPVWPGNILHQLTRMYLRTYICMYVCIYVCAYVSTHACMGWLTCLACCIVCQGACTLVFACVYLPVVCILQGWYNPAHWLTHLS